MAANTISQLTTANTFQHWLTATQSLIGTANLLTNGAGSTFYANTRLEIGGTYGDASIKGNTVIYGDLVVSGNITLDAIWFDDLIVNGSGSFANTLSVTGITTLSNVIVTGNVATLNITSNTVTQNLRVDQTSNFTGNVTLVHANATGTLTVNQLGGTANTAIYSELARISGDSLAFSIALG